MNRAQRLGTVMTLAVALIGAGAVVPATSNVPVVKNLAAAPAEARFPGYNLGVPGAPPPPLRAWIHGPTTPALEKIGQRNRRYIGKGARAAVRTVKRGWRHVKYL